MFAKKRIPVRVSAMAFRKELEHLYARRRAIDSLIVALEQYNRRRVTCKGANRLQSA